MNFINPLFVVGAAAISLPLLIHLVKRERAEKIEFPTLMFLRKISRKSIRYQKLRHLLLLLMRILAFLLLTLAFMRPFRPVPPEAASAAGRISRGFVLLIDNSMSMGYGDRWNRALNAAETIVLGAQTGDKVAVLEFSDRTISRYQLSGDFGGALDRIRSLELTDRATRYAQALKAAEQVVLNASTGRREICLISDFQKSGWAADEQQFRLTSGVELQHVDVGSDDFSNLAFGEVQVVEAEQNVGGALKVKASVVNYGTQDRPNARVRLLVEGRSVNEQTVNVPKSGAHGVEFTLPGLISGVHPLALEVEDPRLVRDNRFSMMVEARDRTAVLSVEGSRGRQQASYFLSRALNVSAISHYQLSTTSPQALESAHSFPARILLWNGAAGGTAAIQKRVQEFVRSGGGLVIVLDDVSMAADFNRSFGSWIPVRAVEESGRTGRRATEDYVLLTNVRMDHPIFRPFSEPHSGTFSTAKFFKHVGTEGSGNAEILARFDNGDPALISAAVEKGRVLVFTSSADDSSNDLPLKAVYAPLWQQMLQHVEHFREGRRWSEVGETISARPILVEAALKQGKGAIDLNQPVVVLDPSKKRLETRPGADALALDSTGFYEVRTVGISAGVAVNAVPRESDITHGNSEEMIAGWLPVDAKPKPALNEVEHRSAEQQDQRQKLWFFLVLAALALLISECVLGNRTAVNSET